MYTWTSLHEHERYFWENSSPDVQTTDFQIRVNNSICPVFAYHKTLSHLEPAVATSAAGTNAAAARGGHEKAACHGHPGTEGSNHDARGLALSACATRGSTKLASGGGVTGAGSTAASCAGEMRTGLREMELSSE